MTLKSFHAQKKWPGRPGQRPAGGGVRTVGQVAGATAPPGAGSEYFAGAGAPRGAGSKYLAGATAPPGAGSEYLAGATAPPGAGSESLAGAAAPPGAGSDNLAGANYPAGANPGPWRTLNLTLTYEIDCSPSLSSYFKGQ